MNSTAQTAIWRERDGALPNTLAIGYALLGYAAGFALMATASWPLNVAGVLLTAHAMLIAAYLIHEAAHYTLFADVSVNRRVGELMSFVAGSAYASFDRIRHLHIRHHRDRADVTCFDYAALLRRQPLLRRIVCALEWAYVPAIEIIMHLQLIARPFVDPTQRKYLPRVLAMLTVRLALLVLVASISLKAVALYFLAYWLLLTALNFFDAFHHTFEQFFVDADTPVPMAGRDRDYEQANTYSNVVSVSHPWLNLLALNFGYHNAHHERAAVPWYRLPALHRELYGERSRELMSLPELLRTWHCNRVRRVLADGYGTVGQGAGRADGFVGAHGVSFLTVV